MNPSNTNLASNAGYAESADRLVHQYESITFEQVYGPLAALVPSGGRAIDIGAGTGRDAAALARKGFSVIAVEPTAELRAHGQRLHPDPAIAWYDDVLPDLPFLQERGVRADLILMTAVWMHLDPEEQGRAMPRISALLEERGRLLMSVRKGPVPPGRRMFEISVTRLIAQAQAHDLALLQSTITGDIHGRPGVSWTKLAFEKTKRV